MTHSFLFSNTNKRYHTYSYAMQRRFGGKVSRIGLDAGFTCPNRDGGIAFCGCAFCDLPMVEDQFSEKIATIPAQYQAGLELMNRKWDTALHIPYLQTGTNTYWGKGVSPKEGLARLRRAYEAALACPGAVGLAIATRPDCLSEGVCDLLEEFSQRTYLTVELGLQTVHDATGLRLNRGHGLESFLQGYARLQHRGIYTGVHLINGLPGETPEDMVDSARTVGNLNPHLVKLHMLFISQGTALGEQWKRGQVSLLPQEVFIQVVCDQLEWIPPETMIGRLTGDGLPDRLLAPLWSTKKRRILNGIDQEMAKRQSVQGICLSSNQR